MEDSEQCRHYYILSKTIFSGLIQQSRTSSDKKHLTNCIFFKLLILTRIFCIYLTYFMALVFLYLWFLDNLMGYRKTSDMNWVKFFNINVFIICVKVFKSWPSKIFQRLPSTNFSWSTFEYFDTYQNQSIDWLHKSLGWFQWSKFGLRVFDCKIIEEK